MREKASFAGSQFPPVRRDPASVKSCEPYRFIPAPIVSWNESSENAQCVPKRVRQMKIAKSIGSTFCLLAVFSFCLAAELDTYRLLSLSESEKLILVSQVSTKTRYLLDASSAKITIDGKPAEYKALKAYSTIQLKMETRKQKRLGIDLDGVAIEISVNAGQKAE